MAENESRTAECGGKIITTNIESNTITIELDIVHVEDVKIGDYVSLNVFRHNDKTGCSHNWGFTYNEDESIKSECCLNCGLERSLTPFHQNLVDQARKNG